MNNRAQSEVNRQAVEDSGNVVAVCGVYTWMDAESHQAVSDIISLAEGKTNLCVYCVMFHFDPCC